MNKVSFSNNVRNGRVVFLLLAVFISSLLISSNIYAEEILISRDKALAQAFPNASRFTKEEFVLTPDQIRKLKTEAKIRIGPKHQSKITLFTAKKDEQVLGYVFEDVVLGKWGIIHYVLALNKKGAVLKVIILDYSEIRGRPIARNRFLKQYKGKTYRNPVRLKKDIDGISGATISSRSITDGIRKLLHIFKDYK